MSKKEVDIESAFKGQLRQVLKEVRVNHNEIVDALLVLSDAVNKINERLDKLPDSEELKQSVEYQATDIREIKDIVLPALLEKAKANTAQVEAGLKVQIDTNTDEILKAEAHSRRKNLIINGMAEVEGETTESLVRKFCVDNLKMEKTEVDKFLFRDVHRLPKSKKVAAGQKPIIMAFVQQKHRNEVLRKAYELKNSGLSLKSDLPKPYNELRGRMLKEKKRLNEENAELKVRVTEKNYLPVLQREDGRLSTGFIKWVEIKCE